VLFLSDARVYRLAALTISDRLIYIFFSQEGSMKMMKLIFVAALVLSTFSCYLVPNIK